MDDARPVSSYKLDWIWWTIQTHSSYRPSEISPLNHSSGSTFKPTRLSVLGTLYRLYCLESDCYWSALLLPNSYPPTANSGKRELHSFLSRSEVNHIVAGQIWRRSAQDLVANGGLSGPIPTLCFPPAAQPNPTSLALLGPIHKPHHTRDPYHCWKISYAEG